MSRYNPPMRRLAAVWFADLVGYSRLSAEDERAALRLLTLFQTVARERVRRDGGHLVKLIGDAAFAEFPSVESAVRGALGLQRDFSARATDLGITTALRIGVHIGDVVIAADGDLYGDGINIAARLQAEADPGQVLVSEDVWRQVRQRKEYTFHPLGQRQLKGIPALVAVYGVTADALAPDEVAAEGEILSGAAPPRRLRSRWATRGWRGRPGAASLTVLSLSILLVVGWLVAHSRAMEQAGLAVAGVSSAGTVAIDRSIAVLPFANLTADPENEYLSDGLTEDIITHLAKIRDLRVISRTSAMQYKAQQKPPRQIGRELGVAHILEGGVRRADDRVRITAQLVDARTDRHLWAETYDRRLEDIFAVQTEIAENIAGALRSELSEADRGRLAGSPTSDPEAYELYLKGRYFWNRRTEDGLTRSIELFRQALARDSGYANAYAGLADAYTILGTNEFRRPQDVFPQAKAAAEAAIRLDPRLAQPHATLGVILSLGEWRWPEGERELRRAIALNPAYPTAHHWYAWTLAPRGRLPEALDAMRRARELDPLSLVIATQTGSMLFYAGRYEEAERELRDALELDPSYDMARAELASLYIQTGAHDEALAAIGSIRDQSGEYSPLPLLARLYARSGNETEARRVLQELLATAAREYVSPVRIALIYIELGEVDRAFERLQSAVDRRDGGLTTLKVHPAFAPIRKDPRFSELLRGMGLT